MNIFGGWYDFCSGVAVSCTNWVATANVKRHGFVTGYILTSTNLAGEEWAVPKYQVLSKISRWIFWIPFLSTKQRNYLFWKCCLWIWQIRGGQFQRPNGDEFHRWICLGNLHNPGKQEDIPPLTTLPQPNSCEYGPDTKLVLVNDWIFLLCQKSVHLLMSGKWVMSLKHQLFAVTYQPALQQYVGTGKFNTLFSGWCFVFFRCEWYYLCDLQRTLLVSRRHDPLHHVTNGFLCNHSQHGRHVGGCGEVPRPPG